MSHAMFAPVLRNETNEQEFSRDMVDFFDGWRGGHIARHGYVGEGGHIYSKWLKTNQAYRSHVTLAEIELITTYVGALAEICGGTQHFVEAGVGSYPAFLMKTHALLASLVARNPDLRYTIADISRASYEEVAGETVKLRLPKPGFHEGNFFETLPMLGAEDSIYVPGLTFTNIPENAIIGDTLDILTNTLSFYSRVLVRGGNLILSYATADGIDSEGTQIKAFYDDPLIHRYQLSIFDRVPKELNIAGDYSPDFKIKHIWRPEKSVLTRHAVLPRPMDFSLDGHKVALRPETFSGYMANNFRPSEEMMTEAAARGGFRESRTFGLPHTNVKIIVCSI